MSRRLNLLEALVLFIVSVMLGAFIAINLNLVASWLT